MECEECFTIMDPLTKDTFMCPKCKTVDYANFENCIMITLRSNQSPKQSMVALKSSSKDSHLIENPEQCATLSSSKVAFYGSYSPCSLNNSGNGIEIDHTQIMSKIKHLDISLELCGHDTDNCVEKQQKLYQIITPRTNETKDIYRTASHDTFHTNEKKKKRTLRMMDFSR